MILLVYLSCLCLLFYFSVFVVHASGSAYGGFERRYVIYFKLHLTVPFCHIVDASQHNVYDSMSGLETGKVQAPQLAE